MKTPNPDHPVRRNLKHLALASAMGAVMYFGASPASAQPPVTTGLRLHLDASALTGLSDGATVNTWTDMSGQGNNATRNAGAPTYETNALNGQPVIRFNNASSFTTLNLSSQFPTATTGFIVTTITNDNAYTLVHANNSVDEWWRYDGNGRSYPAFFRGSRVENYCPMPSSGTRLFAITSSASAWEMAINGVSQGVAAGNYSSAGALTIGNSPNNRWLNGDIAEILIYDSVLSASDVGLVGAYLGTKYGLSTPYGPPTVFNYTPPDNATTVETADFSLTFNEPIAIGTGNITLKNLTDNTQVVITVPNSQVSIAGAVLTINPTADLLLGKSYAIQIAAGAVKDLTDVPFAGILNDTTWNFATAAPTPTTTTVVTSGSPTIYGDSVTYTATVAPIPSGGTVQFYSGFDFVGPPVAVNTITGVATVTTTTLGVTTHEITAEYNGNFQFAGSSTVASISQVVNQAQLTVTASNAVRAPNTANPDPLLFQFTGFKNGENFGSSGVTGSPALSTTAVTASPVGSYPITCAVGTLAAVNYSFAFVNGTLAVVDPASLNSLNVNFTDSTDTGLEGPTGGAGLTWNQVVGTAVSGSLVDSTGAPAVVSTLSSVGTIGGWGNPSLTVLRAGYFQFGKGVDFTVTISGLQAGGGYDLWILTRSNGLGTESNFGTFRTSNTNASGDQVIDSRGVHNGTTWVQGQNYAKFSSVVASPTGEISFTSDGHDPFEIDALDGGSYRLMVSGLQIVKNAPLIAGPVNDAMSTVTAAPASVVANGLSASTVKVTLQDANGVRVPNKQVTLANNGGLTPPNALTTNTQGEANFAVSSSTVGTVVFTATVVADSLTLTDTASVEFTDPEAPVAFSVNFHAGSPATGLVGVVGASGETWNQGTTSASNLIDSTGAVASSVNVTGANGDGYTVNAALNVFDATRTFFGKGQDTTIAISGLVPDTAYDLYIYSLSHNSGSWGDVTDTERAAGDFVTSNTVLGNGQSQWLDNGITGVNGDSFIANGNYVVFQSIVSNSLGNISVVADALDGPGTTRLHVSGLQIRPATGVSLDYAAWRNSQYPGLGLPDEDDDGDGLSNDYERIFGMNPTSPASSSPYRGEFDRATGSLGYTRRVQSLINMNYKVWYSTDLANWFEDNAAIQTAESVSNDIEFMDVWIDPLLLGQPKLFVRVIATPITGVDTEPSLVNLWGSGNSITLLFSEPMNPSSASNPANYQVLQAGGGTIAITGVTLSSDGGSVTLTLASALGTDTGYTVNLDGVTSGTGQPLGTGVVSRQFTTWDDNPNGIKVFILAGQSNMVGYGSVETGNGGVAGAVGSLRYLAVNDASYPDYNYASLLTTPGQPATSPFRTRSDVKVWWRDGGPNLGGTVRKGDLGPPFKGADNSLNGPEFAFGHVMGDFYPTNNVLLVKTAWGGRSLVKDFRPPSAVAARGGRVGDFFSAIIDQTRDVLTNLDTEFPEWSGQGYQIVGFGWHQGFNDMIDATASAEYKDNLPDLIKDVRTVFGKPNLPFSIATTAMADPGPVEPSPYTGYRTIEKAQLWVAGVPKPANVLSTDARPFWRTAAVSPADQGHHWNWNAESYFLIGKSLGDNMVDLLTP